jgi:vitamin B12/bleomycin/antimicrobial peptide transport system ATP-binding/permease protein
VRHWTTLDLQNEEEENAKLTIFAGQFPFHRAIAGLWTSGNGSITRPSDEEVYFLPQRPYCSLGSLKDQLLYPSLDELDETDFPEGHVTRRTHLLKQSLSDQDLLEILEKVDLKDLPARVSPDGDPVKGLKAELDWSNTLSLGEQQRLAFGRLLVNRPRLVILDEATSALVRDSHSFSFCCLRLLLTIFY